MISRSAIAFLFCVQAVVAFSACTQAPDPAGSTPADDPLSGLDAYAERAGIRDTHTLFLRVYIELWVSQLFG